MLFFLNFHTKAKELCFYGLLFLLGVIVLPEIAKAQGHHNIELLSQLEYPARASDIWGYVDDAGGEYAIIGILNGTSIVNVSNPTQPVEVTRLPGDSSVWRDIKTWQHYAYVINEEAGGMQIMDLGDLPNAVNNVYAWMGGFWQDSLINFNTAHSIFIDSLGIGYLSGADVGEGGALMIDIAANPINPPIVGIYDNAYAHDIYVRGNTLYTAEIYNGWFGVVDISNKANPILLATQTTPNDFTHNIALNNEATHLFTTDEKKGSFIAAYDITDLGDIKETDRYQSSPGTNVIPHNVFYYGNHLVNAYYRDGVTLVDVSRPHNLIQTGYYDTSPLSGNSYNGCWGVYPYLPSGILLASDIEGGLFVLNPDYVPACHLEGVISDADTGAPLANVSVEIAGLPDYVETSGFGGTYATGTADSGIHDVTFFLYGYEPQTISVNLVNGVLTELNIQLQPAQPFMLDLSLTDEQTGMAISDAIVNVRDVWVQSDEITNMNGEAQIPLYYAGTHTITLSKWGYIIERLEVEITGAVSMDLDLEPGYYDDFTTDLGWTIAGGAERGIWERAKPEMVQFNTTIIQPPADNPFDIDYNCYLTAATGGIFENVGGGDGVTTLISPAFDLTAYQNPILSFDRWWYTQYAFADTLEISIESNGATTVLLQINGIDPFVSEWHEEIFVLNDYLTPSANMRLKVRAVDSPGSLAIVESAFDVFKIEEGPVPPVAMFQASADTEGCGVLTVEFTNVSENTDAILWTFEGGNVYQTNLANPTVTYTLPGTYDVCLWVSNDLGTDEMLLENFITVYPLPDVSVLSSENEVCLGNMITLSAQSASATAFQWQLPDGGSETAQTFDHAPNIGGVYALTVTDANGCTATDDFGVEVNDFPQFDLAIPTEAVCVGEEVTFAAINANGTYDYVWTGPDGSIAGEQATFTITGDASYEVVATDAAAITCTESRSFEVTTAQAQASFFANVQAVCLGEAVLLTSNSQNADDFVWEATNTLSGSVLNGVGETLELSLNEVGSYNVHLTASGCGSDELTLPNYLTVYEPPQISASVSASEVCPGETVSLTASGDAMAYVWYENGNAIGTQAEIDVLVNQTATYSLIGTDANGCESQAEVSVMASSAANPPVAAFTIGEPDICEGDAVVLINQSQNADSVLWELTDALGNTINSTDDPPQFAPNVGVYNVSLTAYDCDTMVVYVLPNGLQVHENPEPPIVEGDLSICLEGGNATLSAITPYNTYLWSDGSTAAAITAIMPGEYCVTVANTIGCKNVACVEVETYTVEVTCVPPYQYVCEGEPAIIGVEGEFVSYSWDFGDTTEIMNRVFPFFDATLGIGVTVTDANGCTGIGHAAVVVEICEGVDEENSSLQNVSIYPNPNAGTFAIAVQLPDGLEELQLTIYNVLGKRVWQQNYGKQSGDFKALVHLLNRVAGIYFAELKWGNERKILRFAVD